MYDQSKIAFIDTETTGLHPENCEVWEIAIIVDGVEHCWQNRISYRAFIDPWVLENTRFGTDYDKYTATNVGETADKLIELLSGRHLVGACPWFDSERLHRLLRYNHVDWYGKAETPWHYHLIDIECLMIGADTRIRGDKNFPAPLPWKSDDLANHFGLKQSEEDGEKHTALGDARWAKRVFEYFYGEGQ